MDTSNMIEITGVDLAGFIKAAFDLSKPQGFGYLHYTPQPLPDDEVAEIIDREKKVSFDTGIAASMDYVHGRAVKMTVFREGDRLFIRSDWFDHTKDQLEELLRRTGVRSEASQENPHAE